MGSSLIQLIGVIIMFAALGIGFKIVNSFIDWVFGNNKRRRRDNDDEEDVVIVKRRRRRRKDD